MAKTKSAPVPSRNNGYESLSVRPIDNGYLICRSTPKGYSEVYSANKPKIDMPQLPKAKSAPAKPAAKGGMSAVKRAADSRR